MNCSSILGVSESDLLKPDIRSTKFCEEIGWVSETGKYSNVDVPILHKDWHGEYLLSSIFLNLKLMGVSLSYIIAAFRNLISFPQIYVALIHGSIAGEGFIKGGSLQLWTKTMAPTHKICNITPGTIATCGALVCSCHMYWHFYITKSPSQPCWVLSADDTLQEVGLSTSIHYFNDFKKYLTILETGLWQKETSVLNIFRQWAEKIFPIETRRVQKVMDLLLADLEDEIKDRNRRASRSIASLNPVVV